MNDLDRTFETLRRITFTNLLSKIKIYTDGFDGICKRTDNDDIFMHPGCESFCIQHKWTLDEVNRELNDKTNRPR